jgi:hypothetical protein
MGTQFSCKKHHRTHRGPPETVTTGPPHHRMPSCPTGVNNRFSFASFALLEAQYRYGDSIFLQETPLDPPGTTRDSDHRTTGPPTTECHLVRCEQPFFVRFVRFVRFVCFVCFVRRTMSVLNQSIDRWVGRVSSLFLYHETLMTLDFRQGAYQGRSTEADERGRATEADAQGRHSIRVRAGYARKEW